MKNLNSSSFSKNNIPPQPDSRSVDTSIGNLVSSNAATLYLFPFEHLDNQVPSETSRGRSSAFVTG